ncbi:MAG: BMP family protein [Candidatus Melainabacteria bacterium]|nr:BMP family protein [Candidatus Melainabacteria bacterium]MBI3309657.1 BMP family protein [Candidatus Melainabacteria bacterium]
MKTLYKYLYIFLFFSLLVLFCSSCIRKQEFNFNTKNPQFVLILPGPINDSSLNEEAYKGLKRFKGDYGIVRIAAIEKVAVDELPNVVAGLIKLKYDYIIAHGYDYGSTLQKITRKYPDVFFCNIGGDKVQAPNLCTFNFKDEQYGYLVGVVAGLNTATNKVGIIVGGKTPSVERVIIGMRKGLRAVNPKADLVVSYINSWTDITKGKEAANTQINTGVDILTHLADRAGIGIIKAAEEADISVIGAIQDQHSIAPTTVINSGIEDASQLVYLACEHYIDKTLLPIDYRYGLKHQVVDLTPSHGNIDPSTENRISAIKRQLTDIEVRQDEIEENKKLRRQR